MSDTLWGVFAGAAIAMFGYWLSPWAAARVAAKGALERLNLTIDTTVTSLQRANLPTPEQEAVFEWAIQTARSVADRLEARQKYLVLVEAFVRWCILARLAPKMDTTLTTQGQHLVEASRGRYSIESVKDEVDGGWADLKERGSVYRVSSTFIKEVQLKFPGASQDEAEQT